LQLIKKPTSLHYQTGTNLTQQKKMEATQFINAEFQRRIDLIENAEFCNKMAILAQEIGISAKEWNENKAVILMTFANKYCQLQNELA
jgi:hypothetical protein